MGNTSATLNVEDEDDIWWTNGNTTPNQVPKPTDSNLSQDFLDDFNEKRLQRRQILENKKKEIDDLRNEVVNLRLENQRLKKGIPIDHAAENIEQLKRENELLKGKLHTLNLEQVLKVNLQKKNEALREHVEATKEELKQLRRQVEAFEEDKSNYKAHVVALKDVIAVSKQMLLIKENQLKQLQSKVGEIEATLSNKDMVLIPKDRRDEYERQMENIRKLRSLYDERQQAHDREKMHLVSVLKEKGEELKNCHKTISELKDRIEELEKDNSDKYDQIKHLESNLGLSKAETRQYKAELDVINKLFTQILLEFNNTQDVDLDKLAQLLEEHHDLLQTIATNEISSEVSTALPKMLLDLVNQLNGDDEPENQDAKKPPETDNPATSGNQSSALEIMENLPKVWRVLKELLSHHQPLTDRDEGEEEDNSCYKTVNTPKGPNLVLSVSGTFIRLKDLILEKKLLEKDLTNLKQLNTHLETRLQDQEKRLEVVSTELTKTWHFVGKLQKEHQVLHTQEKILRYELAQKRKLLTELRSELEYSREKWRQAREKNSTTQQQWDELRLEFASRKINPNMDNNNSIESGYSDEREGSSSDDEDREDSETDISELNRKTTPSSTSNNSDVEIVEADDKADILEIIQCEMDNIAKNVADCDESVIAPNLAIDGEAGMIDAFKDVVNCAENVEAPGSATDGEAKVNALADVIDGVESVKAPNLATDSEVDGLEGVIDCAESAIVAPSLATEAEAEATNALEDAVDCAEGAVDEPRLTTDSRAKIDALEEVDESVVKGAENVVDGAESIVKAPNLATDGLAKVNALAGVIDGAESAKSPNLATDSETDALEGVVDCAESATVAPCLATDDEAETTNAPEDLADCAEGVVDIPVLTTDSKAKIDALEEVDESVIKGAESVVDGAESVVKAPNLTTDGLAKVNALADVIDGAESAKAPNLATDSEVDALEGVIDGAESAKAPNLATDSETDALEGVIDCAESAMIAPSLATDDEAETTNALENVVDCAEGVVDALGLTTDSKAKIDALEEIDESVVKSTESVVKGAEGVIDGAEGVIDGAEGVTDGAEGVAEASVLATEAKKTALEGESPKRTLEEVLLAREERLKRLEGQCQQLVTKVTNTSHRSVEICNKLEDLHEIYGENSRSTNEVNQADESVDDPDNQA